MDSTGSKRMLKGGPETEQELLALLQNAQRRFRLAAGSEKEIAAKEYEAVLRKFTSLVLHGRERRRPVQRSNGSTSY